MSDTLISEAERAGFTVERTRGGHIRFRAPDGRVVIDASTPSDYRSTKNTRARLKRIGLGANVVDAGEQRRESEAKKKAADASTSVQVLELFQASANPLSPEAAAATLGLTAKQVTAALYRLRSKGAPVERDGAGRWRVERAQSKPAPTKPERKQRLRIGGDVLKLLQEGAGEALSISQMAKHLNVSNANISAALHNLQRKHPEVQAVRRGCYAYIVREPTERERAEIRLRLLSRELRKDPPAAVRVIIREEMDRLEELLSKPESAAPAAVATNGLGPQLPTAGAPELFEPVSATASGRLVLRDDQGKLWLARPLVVDDDV